MDSARADSGQARQRRREASIDDVARRAGVSGQTVSRVANGRSNVGAATRERVLEAMRELGYRPNSAARALRSGQFRSIGVIVFTLTSYGNLRTLEAVAAAATERRYTITLMPLEHPTHADVSVALDRLGEQAVDGVIVLIESRLTGGAEARLRRGVPVVTVDSRVARHSPVVDTDQLAGARLATEHLLGLGHETVWHVAGPRDSDSAGLRLRGWRETLRAHGRRVPEVLHGDWYADSGYAAGRRLAAEPGVTAVFAANDQMALGVLRALTEAGLRIPADVSVAGFDDMPEARNFIPPLTTVHQDFAAIGRTAVDALVQEIEGGPPAAYTGVAPRLTVRSSTAGPATHRPEGAGPPA
ncbi:MULTISPECIES: LacI family DNA-binding transcriptional regulator [unclassified Streptomyces]|uniref:LacI family DNA-binding transcriptional regulator n=1 Tax=unclassified Streptomyces TaxID=2593676 RepID=UPI00093D2FF2|nr:LacI family DNA-binding transcriptional regulator [Streptomyces sp. CB02058]OKI94466.1 LacI family transcriptional regulator [Streptomyces sp. CB02058]